VLLNITGGQNLTLFEVNEASEIIAEAADPEANIIFGAVIDESLKEEVRVTVIATGFDQQKASFGKVGNSSEQIIRPVAAAAEDLDIPEFLRRRR
jgi:cell division protein FtsZ